MSPKRGHDAVDQFAEWLDTALKVDEIEWMTLKGHIVIEDALKYLLASKLKADLVKFPADIKIRNFHLLLDLAFTGEDSTVHPLIGALKILNNARNGVSHWLTHEDFTARVKQFVTAMAALQNPHEHATLWSAEEINQHSLGHAFDDATMAILTLAMHHQKIDEP